MPAGADRAHAVRHAELRRLGVAVREGGRALNTNRAQLQAVVDDLVPGARNGPVTGKEIRLTASARTEADAKAILRLERDRPCHPSGITHRYARR